MNREVLWRTLFLMLATVNITVLGMSTTTYSSLISPLNTQLVEEFENVLVGSGLTAYSYGNIGSTDALAQVKALRPPFWKVSKHQEYAALAQDLRTMETEVREVPMMSTDTLRMSYSRVPSMKKEQTDQIIKSLVENQQRQKATRLLILPKYKDKLDRFKKLGQSLS